MADIKDRAREYLAEHSEYSEVFGETFIAVDTFTAMVEFAEQETKELKAQIEGKENEFKYFSNSFKKKIAELEDKLANADYQLEGRDLKIKELETRCNELFLQTCEQAELIEKMKCCSNCKNEGDYKEPYRYGTGWCNICKRHKVAKGNFDKWEIKE